jgi:hypothetical protein
MLSRNLQEVKDRFCYVVQDNNEVESLISLYADDTFLILDGSENSLREALECFESFYKVSGLKMNSSKTKAVWVGNKKYSDQIICPNMKLNWSHENFKVLGIDFSLDLNCITDVNFTKKIKEIKAILRSWQDRKLTLLGKITVIKTLALPKLRHLVGRIYGRSSIISILND